MKVKVDLDRCEGHGRCEAAAPEVFRVEDDSSLVLIKEPGKELWPNVRRAARLCPRQAVIVEE